MKKTKNIIWALIIAVIAVFMIAILANCVSAQWSYAERDSITKEYFDNSRFAFLKNLCS